MISVTEATDIIFAHTLSLSAEEVPLDKCIGRVLCEDLIADRDFPPFDRVTMDGIAINYETWKNGHRKFHIQEVAPAGATQTRLADAVNCIEIMTGAILPEGCDTVIRYEDLKITDTRQMPLNELRREDSASGAGANEGNRNRKDRTSLSNPIALPQINKEKGARKGEGENLPPGPLKGEHVAEILPDQITKGQNIHNRGIDRKAGEVIVKAGKKISTAEIGVAATIGKSVLHVGGLPTIAVISTGDELVDTNKTPLPHQIRKSNVHQISAVLEQYGVTVKSYHIPDDAKEVEKKLKKILTEYDGVILSGGVSAGKYDYVPDALEKLGVEKLFHQVAQRPGKPFWFGVKKERQQSEDGELAFRQAQRPVSEPVEERTEDWRLRTIVFALPGNPVSTFMCTIRYIIPWLEKTLGIPHRQQFAVLSEDVNFKATLTYFLQVKLEHHRDGRLRAHPVAGHGSGDLANLVEADAFLELEEGEHVYHEGGSFRVWRFRE